MTKSSEFSETIDEKLQQVVAFAAELYQLENPAMTYESSWAIARIRVLSRLNVMRYAPTSVE